MFNYSLNIQGKTRKNDSRVPKQEEDTTRTACCIVSDTWTCLKQNNSAVDIYKTATARSTSHFSSEWRRVTARPRGDKPRNKGPEWSLFHCGGGGRGYWCHVDLCWQLKTSRSQSHLWRRRKSDLGHLKFPPEGYTSGSLRGRIVFWLCLNSLNSSSGNVLSLKVEFYHVCNWQKIWNAICCHS